jgi:hypothetical protein
MNAERFSHPNIAADLVIPFERPFFEGKNRFGALVFARRGALVLFATECRRQFGVGFLDDSGTVARPDHYPCLDMAARAFLALDSCSA